MLLSLPGIGYGLWASEDQLIRFFPDDAFYYLKTASNWVRLGWITFDGLHSTNGFHPVYFLVTSGLSLLFTSGALLRASFALNHLLIQLSVALAIHAGCRSMPIVAQIALLSAVSLPTLFAGLIISSGLEASAVVLCTVLLYLGLQRAAERRFESTRRNLLLGAALSLWMLTRLDLAVGVPVVAAYVAWASRRVGRAAPAPDWITRMISVFALPLLSGSAYLALNYRATAHLVPISGFVKSVQTVSFATSWDAATLGGGVRGFLFGTLPLAASLGTLAWLRVRGTRSSAGTSALVPVNLANLAFYAYLLGYARNFFPWYLAFPVACLAIDVAVVAPACWPRIRGLGSASREILTVVAVGGAIVNVAANLAFLGWTGNHPRAVSFHLKQIAALVNRFAGEESVTGVFDAGIVAY